MAKAVPTNSHVVYELTAEDILILEQLTLIKGAGSAVDAAMHKMCVMQVASMLTNEADHAKEIYEHAQEIVQGTYKPKFIEVDDDVAFSYEPVCVSSEIMTVLIYMNDNLPNDKRQKLLEIIPDVFNTCPVIRRERRRGNQHGTTVTIVDEADTNNDQYQQAEEKRREMLKGVGSRKLTLDEKLERIRRAANLFKVKPPTTTSS